MKPSPAGLTADPAVARALAMIEARHAEPLDVASIARAAGVSRSVLSERFARVVGCSPMRHCNHVRLDRAASILRDGGTSAAEVAFKVGFGSEAAFSRAFRRRFGAPPIAWLRERQRGAVGRLPEQSISHCHAADGTRIAWSQMGEGFPLVKTANWLNHLEFDFQSPVWRHWLEELSHGRTLIRYDERGNGLSDWDTPAFTLDAFVDDFEAVVQAAGTERFDIVAMSQGVAVAIAFAVRNPRRIRRMVLVGGFAQGWRLRMRGDALARVEAMVTLSRTGWGGANPAFRRMFTNLYIPDGSEDQIAWWDELQRVSTSPANAERLQNALGLFDVKSLLPQIDVPVLVLHSERDQVIPFPLGQELAREIPGARFVPLDSANHVLLAEEPAWAVFRREVGRFLAP